MSKITFRIKKMETRGRRAAASQLQQWWRAFLRHTDPITLGPVRTARVWADGLLFNIDTLRAYVAQTGDTIHPTTRRPLTGRVLARLGVNSSLAQARRARAQRVEHEAMVTYLEQEASGHVRAIVADVIADVVADAGADAGADVTMTDAAVPNTDSIAATIVRLVRDRFPAFAACITDLGRLGAPTAGILRNAVQTLRTQEVEPERFAVFLLAYSFFRDYERLATLAEDT